MDHRAAKLGIMPEYSLGRQAATSVTPRPASDIIEMPGGVRMGHTRNGAVIGCRHEAGHTHWLTKDRVKRSLMVGLVMMGAAMPMVHASDAQAAEQRFFTTEECVAAGHYSPQRCQDAYQDALRVHRATAPAFYYRQQCDQVFGGPFNSDPSCEAFRQEGSSSTLYRPLMFQFGMGWKWLTPGYPVYFNWASPDRDVNSGTLAHLSKEISQVDADAMTRGAKVGSELNWHVVSLPQHAEPSSPVIVVQPSPASIEQHAAPTHSPDQASAAAQDQSAQPAASDKDQDQGMSLAQRIIVRNAMINTGRNVTAALAPAADEDHGSTVLHAPTSASSEASPGSSFHETSSAHETTSFHSEGGMHFGGGGGHSGGVSA